MYDEWGRENNRCQAIRELNIGPLAYLFYLIKSNPQNYPNTIEDWITWLEKRSGESVENF